MFLGNSNYSIEGCFEAAKSNNFCGTMIIMGDLKCYCRGKGKEDSCTKRYSKAAADLGWKVYRESGMPEYGENNEKFCWISYV